MRWPALALLATGLRWAGGLLAAGGLVARGFSDADAPASQGVRQRGATSDRIETIERELSRWEEQERILRGEVEARLQEMGAARRRLAEEVAALRSGLSGAEPAPNEESTDPASAVGPERALQSSLPGRVALAAVALGAIVALAALAWRRWTSAGAPAGTPPGGTTRLTGPRQAEPERTEAGLPAQEAEQSPE